MITLDDLRGLSVTRNTGYRTPREPTLGFYTLLSADSGLDPITHNEVHQTEIRLGVNYIIDPRMNSIQIKHQEELMYRQLHSHLYGSLRNDLCKVLDDLRCRGLYQDDAAMVSLFKVLDEVSA